MSEPWTDERIREAFIYDGGESAYHDPINGEKEQRRIAGDIFDAWLAEHDRQVAERAWDEAWDSSGEGWNGEYLPPGQAAPNPYRAAKGEQK